jgi:putative transposase
MDGRDRAFGNIFVERLWRSVKFKEVYLMGYSNSMELMIGLTEYFLFTMARDLTSRWAT